MLELKLWHNKTETKNVTVTKMMEFIKAYDQYACKFDFGHFFSSITLPPFFSEGKTDFQKILQGGNSFLLPGG